MHVGWAAYFDPPETSAAGRRSTLARLAAAPRWHQRSSASLGVEPRGRTTPATTPPTTARGRRRPARGATPGGRPCRAARPAAVAWIGPAELEGGRTGVVGGRTAHGRRRRRGRTCGRRLDREPGRAARRARSTRGARRARAGRAAPAGRPRRSGTAPRGRRDVAVRTPAGSSGRGGDRMAARCRAALRARRPGTAVACGSAVAPPDPARRRPAPHPARAGARRRRACSPICAGACAVVAPGGGRTTPPRVEAALAVGAPCATGGPHRRSATCAAEHASRRP